MVSPEVAATEKLALVRICLNPHLSERFPVSLKSSAFSLVSLPALAGLPFSPVFFKVEDLWIFYLSFI